jgi:PAS domain S-box-containing protein
VSADPRDVAAHPSETAQRREVEAELRETIRQLRRSQERAQMLAQQAAEQTGLLAAEREARGEAEALLRVAQAINSAQLDLEALVQVISDEATALVGAQLGAFFYDVRKTDGEPYSLYAVSGAPREAFEALGLPRNAPLFAPTFEGQRVIRLDDVKNDPRYATMAPQQGAVTSYLAVPVISRDGSVIGGLFFGHAEPARFTEQHERLGSAIGAMAAVALDNAMLFRTTREAEEKQRRLAEGMAETVRLNDLFTGVLAHDLRNPLTGILTAARLAATRAKDDQLARPLARILNSGERMTRMVDQLLDLARVRLGQSMPLTPRPLDILPVVQHVADELQDSHRASPIRIEQTGDTAGLWDPDRVGQALSNLVGNAVQHGAGGEVRVEVDGTKPEAVTFRIHNRGAIPPALIPTLFDPFSAANRPREKSRGLGLGMFIAQEIARAHGGGIELHSAEPAGTTVSVTLPRITGQVRATPPTPNRALVEARERAWQSEQRMRLMVDSIRDYGIFMLDLQGRVASWNTGAQRLKGYTAEEIIGKQLSTFYTAADREARRPEMLIAQAATEGRVEDIGWRVRKDGSLFWANVTITALRDSQGHLCGFAKVTRDLTERRLQEERARRSEEQFRLMVESVQDYAIFKLSPDGIVTTWNAGAERIKGYRAPEIIGQHFSRFYDLAEVQAGKCAFELEMASREGRFEDEGWRLRKDGSRFWANVVITALRGFDGDLLGFAKVTRDLTDRRRLDDERVRRAQAEEAIRLRDEFVSMVSHELKTPLTGLQLQLQALVRKMKTNDPKVAVQLHRAAASGNRLASLIEMLLDVARIADGGFQLSPELLDLATLVAGVADRFSDAARKAAAPMAVRSEGSLLGRWDRLRMEQLVASLLSNALKYGAGGSIDVKVSGRGEGVLLEVRDRGPGIPAEDLEGLFERFGRRGSMRHHGGLGLGLYLVREIAHAHGGQVEVRNASDGGAYFAVQLPRETTTADSGGRPGELQ